MQEDLEGGWSEVRAARVVDAAVHKKTPGSACAIGRQLSDDARSLQLGCDGRECRGQVGADCAQDSYRSNRDQSGDQAVLNCGRPVLIIQELGQGRKHIGFSIWKADPPDIARIFFPSPESEGFVCFMIW
jgi:hypothetical protein